MRGIAQFTAIQKVLSPLALMLRCVDLRWLTIMNSIAPLAAKPVERFTIPEVLCYGHDKLLLYTRQQILGRLGCVSATVSNAADYWPYLLEKAPSVIVYCQTLTRAEFEEAVLFAENYRSSAGFVVMYTRTPPLAEGPRCKLLAAQDGPQAFGRAVFTLL